MLPLAAPGGAAAVPAEPPPLVAPPGEACAPSGAWISTERGDRWLTSPSGTCTAFDAATGLTRTTIADGTLISTATPRLLLRRGEIVTIHFVSAPRAVVLLRARPGPRATTGTTFRLSPFATTWRARPGSGILEFGTSEHLILPAGVVPGDRVEFVGYAAVYRTIR